MLPKGEKLVPKVRSVLGSFWKLSRAKLLKFLCFTIPIFPIYHLLKSNFEDFEVLLREAPKKEL